MNNRADIDWSNDERLGRKRSTFIIKKNPIKNTRDNSLYLLATISAICGLISSLINYAIYK
tara:strand:+ start:1917 stop:2099 length:183 start_codon:yes stop_codon:yes gene_type:complete